MKDAHNTHRSIHVDCKSDSDDEKKEFAEFIWPSEDKPCCCSSLKPIPKNRQEQVRFTFHVSKFDRIFDELLRSGNIKLSHAIPPLESKNGMHIASGIIVLLMQLMIAIFFVEKSNRPLMTDDWQCMRCKMTRRHSLSIQLIWIMSRYSFGQNKPKEQKEKCYHW
jgi:hypothetical protein